MSVLSLSFPPAAPEPVVARRAAPEQEDGRETATFTLPEEPVQERPAPAASTKERAEPKPADEPAPKREDKATEAAPGKPSPDKTAADDTKATDKPKVAGKPADATAAPAMPVVPAAGVEQPKLDAAAIVAIAAASQIVTGTAQGGTDAKSETKDKKDGEQLATVDGKAIDPSAILPTPPVLVDVASIAGAASALAAGPAEGQGDAAALAGIAVAVPGAAAVTSVDSAPAQGGDAAPAIGSQPKSPVVLAVVASTETVAKTGAGHETDKPAAGGEAAASPSARDAALDKPGQAAAPGAFADIVKTAEAAPQAQTPIDLSAIVAPRGGRPEGLPGLDALAQATAQQASAPPGHGTAGGSPTPLHVVPIEIGLRALAGAKSFDIRLDPVELGRIDVNLEISDKGEVSARLVVDRVETLHLLQRDARTLERAFEQAGLKPSDAGVDITLRDPSDQSGFRQGRQDQEASRQARGGSKAGDEDPVILAQPAPVRRLVRLGGVDLSI